MTTETKPSNPKAFPSQEFIKEDGFGSYTKSHVGMTLRDYFAAKEKAQLTLAFWTCESFQAVIIQQAKEDGEKNPDNTLSAMAYQSADSMLKQREL